MSKIIIGIILCFIGGCEVFQTLGDKNEMAALGGAVIALFFFLIGIPLLIMGTKSQQKKKEIDVADLRKCPYCAEDIKKEAIICRYCGKEQPTKEKKPGNEEKLQRLKELWPDRYK